MGVVGDEMGDEVVRTGWHWQFGWLRRRDLDDDNGYCYEEPDGDRVYFRDAECRNMVLLEQRLLEGGRDTYLCLCHSKPTDDQLRKLARLYMKFKLPRRPKVNK